MATTSTAVTVKAALVSRLSARAGLTGVQVSYFHPGPDKIREEAIYLDKVAGRHDARVTTPGRLPREETYTVDVIVHVLDPDGTPQVAETRALAIFGEIEGELADTPRLGLVGVIDWAEVREWELETALYEDGRLARIKVGIEVFAQLQ